MSELAERAARIATELADDLRFARSRPPRQLHELDTHFDKLMERVENLARIVQRLAEKRPPHA